MRRKDFLRSASLGIAGGLLATTPARALDRLEASDLRERSRLLSATPDWEEVRSRFGVDPSYIHMAGLFLASHPASVGEAIERYRSELDADPVGSVTGRWGWEQRVQESAVEYLEAGGPHEVGLTGSTTMGLGILIHGLEVGPGEEILQTTHDHQVTNDAVAYKADLSRADARLVDLYSHDRPEEVQGEDVVERVQREIRPETRALVATWVHSSTGVKLPIPEMAEAVEAANRGRDERDRVVFIVDGVHGFGTEAEPVGALGCDFLSAGTHKWLFGPRGTGVVWGREAVQDRVKPVIPSVGGGAGWGGTMSPGGFHAFEHRWALDRAFHFHMELGRERVAHRVGDLAEMMKEGLAEMDHVRLYTPMSRSLSSALVCFDVDGLDRREVVDRLLGEHGIIASTTPYDPSYARFTPGLLNDEGEVDACLRAVRAMA